MRKGQIAIFILFAFVIIAAFGLIELSKEPINQKLKSSTEAKLSNAGYAAPVNAYVQNCLNLAGKEAVKILGWQGGHIIFQPESLITSYSIISYAYDEGQNNLAAKSQMEDEISLYAGLYVQSCLSDFEFFAGYNISSSDFDANTIIRDDSVLIKIHYPVSIKTKESSFKISDFSTIVPVRLGYLHGVLNSIVEKQQEDNGWVPISFMSDINLTINLYPYNETNLVYEIIDNQSLMDDKPYKILLASRFQNE